MSQVQQQQQQLVLVLLHKPLQPILNRILQLKCLQREKKKQCLLYKANHIDNGLQSQSAKGKGKCQ